MLREKGEVAVPPTIHALLQARLDALRSEERAVMECAAVEGEVFHRGTILQLAPESDVDAQLPALVRKELIRPEAPALPEDDAYRFRHLLIRDAAYESLPKELRAELHERFALWLEEHTELVEQDEIVGYHLEQAYRYRMELDESDPRRGPLSERAAEHLGAAGQAALGRADYEGGINLLERAIAMLPTNSEQRPALLSELGHALVGTGRFDDTRACARELVGLDALWKAHGTLLEHAVGWHVGWARPLEEVRSELARAMTIFEEHGDELGMAGALTAEADIAWSMNRAGECAKLREQALVHAERANHLALIQELREGLVMNYSHGPTPADAAIPTLEAMLEHGSGLLVVEAAAKRGLARIAAARGDFDAARELMYAGVAPIGEMGLVVQHAALCQGSAFVERMAGDLGAEERELRGGLEVLDSLGERAFSSTLAVLLADCLAHQGRDAEAQEYVRLVRERTPPHDLTNYIGADATEAVLRARRGEHEDAERLALRAVERAETTDFWETRGQSFEALGAVYLAAGRREEARSAYASALEVYDAKEASVPAERLRALVAEL